MTSKAVRAARRRNRQLQKRKVTLSFGSYYGLGSSKIEHDDPSHVAIDARLKALGLPSTGAMTTTADQLQQMYDAAIDGSAKDVIASRIKGHRAQMAEHIAKARSPMAGDAVGLRIIMAGIQDAQDVWGAVHHMRMVYAAHASAIGAPARHAKVATVLLPRDSIETSADAPPYDSRTHDERVQSIMAAWDNLQSWMAPAPDAERATCVMAVVDEVSPCPPLHLFIKPLRYIMLGLSGARIPDHMAANIGGLDAKL